MRYFLGVDSGGTKTTAVLVDIEGNFVAQATAGPTDIINAGKASAVEEIKKCVEKVLFDSGASIKDIEYACFGMSGYGDVACAEQNIEEVVNSVLSYKRVIINDVRAALEGAIPLKAGAVILAGTGAMCMAKDNDGTVFRTDGWGEHIGDLGSAYYIGQMGLRSVFKAYDGREKIKTLLVEKAKEYLLENGEEDTDIRRIVDNCKGGNIRSYIAGFSKKVDEAAKENDEISVNILENAAEELFCSLKSVVENAKLKKISEKVSVSFAGSVFKSEIMCEKLTCLIENEGYVLEESEFSPEYGAVIYAAGKVFDTSELKNFVGNLSENKL